MKNKGLKRNLAVFAFAVLLALTACSCAPGAKETPRANALEGKETTVTQQQLLRQIRVEEDEFLSSEPDPLEKVTLSQVYAGNFTGGAEEELLAVFTADAPHVAGSKRTILCVLDRASLENKKQLSVACDDLQLRCYEDETGKDYLLILGAVSYQGVAAYHAQMLDAAKGELIPVGGEGEMVTLSADGGLMVFRVDNNGGDRPGIQKISLASCLCWDAQTACFQADSRAIIG